MFSYCGDRCLSRVVIFKVDVGRSALVDTDALDAICQPPFLGMENEIPRLLR